MSYDISKVAVARVITERGALSGHHFRKGTTVLIEAEEPMGYRCKPLESDPGMPMLDSYRQWLYPEDLEIIKP